MRKICMIKFLSRILVHQLRRYNLQPSAVFYKAIDHANYPSHLLLGAARRFLLAHPVLNSGERNLLYYLVLCPYF